MNDVPRPQVFNERVKLLANNLDRASSTCFTVGVATPAAGFLYNISGLQTLLSPSLLAAGVTGWLLASASLHYLARRTLGRLLP